MTQQTYPNEYLSLKEASRWASEFLKKEVTQSNISYLVQYGKLQKYKDSNLVKIKLKELIEYYRSYNGYRELAWKEKLGNDLNWQLSFDNFRESETTKHVHRLHPYKGKFIPQLVEYFLDNHTDNFKRQLYFQKGDIILDPFVGSGTTIVQANELGIHGIGIDISRFNCLIGEIKLLNYDFLLLSQEINSCISSLIKFELDENVKSFEKELNQKLNEFNNTYFPSPIFKYKVNKREINESQYAIEKEEEFLTVFDNLIRKYKIVLRQTKNEKFLDKWYVSSIRKEIDFMFSAIKKIKDVKTKKIMAIILTRTIRSCRATTHSDLATLKNPQLATYYCFKHKKICKPIFSIKSMFIKYAQDTLFRLKEFNSLRTSASWKFLTADSRTVDILNLIKKNDEVFYKILKNKKIKGIFTSPPYVGQIDYHEQHAYAYDLLGFKRNDDLEIGPLYKGQGVEARRSYIEGIADVLNNCKKYLSEDYDVFLVANDKYNLYPEIAKKSGMKIVDQFKRPVLNRTERDKSPYSEIIFHLKEL